MSRILSQLESKLAHWESDDTLLEQSSFSSRMEVLDGLDRFFSESELTASGAARDLANRARAFSAKLNSLNNQLFQSIRRQIQEGICPSEFRIIVERQSTTPQGLAYDYLDDLLAGVLQFEPPVERPLLLGAESVFYQPTPARHIFHLITAAAISRADRLIDLGSGLGHVPLLASICTGATSGGIELDPAWVASARRCTEALNLHKVTFQVQDAREADLSTGTIFYLYTPFSGSTLMSVLDRLREQATRRPLRICTFGPCTIIIAQQPWLTADSPPDPEQITIFQARS